MKPVRRSDGFDRMRAGEAQPVGALANHLHPAPSRRAGGFRWPLPAARALRGGALQDLVLKRPTSSGRPRLRFSRPRPSSL